ncbi:hypothetical protein BGX31_004932 [Mortierella sp. GBA43]|nr:hypothetical protein BGX31_004932 [Mortierella sp. GBA43]
MHAVHFADHRHRILTAPLNRDMEESPCARLTTDLSSESYPGSQEIVDPPPQHKDLNDIEQAEPKRLTTQDRHTHSLNMPIDDNEGSLIDLTSSPDSLIMPSTHQLLDLEHDASTLVQVNDKSDVSYTGFPEAGHKGDYSPAEYKERPLQPKCIPWNPTLTSSLSSPGSTHSASENHTGDNQASVHDEPQVGLHNQPLLDSREYQSDIDDTALGSSGSSTDPESSPIKTPVTSPTLVPSPPLTSPAASPLASPLLSPTSMNGLLFPRPPPPSRGSPRRQRCDLERDLYDDMETLTPGSDSEEERRRFQTEVRKLEQRQKQLLKDIEQAEEDERQIQALNAEKHELDILMEDLQSQELELNEASAQLALDKEAIANDDGEQTAGYKKAKEENLELTRDVSQLRKLLEETEKRNERLRAERVFKEAVANHKTKVEKEKRTETEAEEEDNWNNEDIGIRDDEKSLMEEIANALGHNVDDYDLRSPNPWNKLDGYTNVMATSPRVSVTLHASELSMALKEEEIEEHEAPPAYDPTGAIFSQISPAVDLGVQPAANPQDDTEEMTQKQDEVLPDIDISEVDKEEDQEHPPRPLDTSKDTDVAQFNDANVGLGAPLSVSDLESIETLEKEPKEELRPLTQPDLAGAFPMVDAVTPTDDAVPTGEGRAIRTFPIDTECTETKGTSSVRYAR